MRAHRSVLGDREVRSGRPTTPGSAVLAGTLCYHRRVSDLLTPELQRALATSLYAEAWKLAEASSRTVEDDRRMLTCAFASRLHWEGIGTDLNLAIGDWMIAHVASCLGYADVALAFATAAYERTSRVEMPAWMKASAAEGMARAHAAASDATERDRYLTEARAGLEAIDDAEDRELIAGQIATVPPARLSAG